jgi:hypothetical protein
MTLQWYQWVKLLFQFSYNETSGLERPVSVAANQAEIQILIRAHAYRPYISITCMRDIVNKPFNYRPLKHSNLIYQSQLQHPILFRISHESCFLRVYSALVSTLCLRCPVTGALLVAEQLIVHRERKLLSSWTAWTEHYIEMSVWCVSTSTDSVLSLAGTGKFQMIRGKTPGFQNLSTMLVYWQVSNSIWINFIICICACGGINRKSRGYAQKYGANKCRG